jgi:hypothetical protein
VYFTFFKKKTIIFQFYIFGSCFHVPLLKNIPISKFPATYTFLYMPPILFLLLETFQEISGHEMAKQQWNPHGPQKIFNLKNLKMKKKSKETKEKKQNKSGSKPCKASFLTPYSCQIALARTLLSSS